MAPEDPGRPDARRVLIVDDDHDTRLLYRTFLSMEGFAVTDLGDAESALRRVDEDAPHVVITDVVLPGLSGIDLALAIRERDPSRRIALIAVTGRVTMGTTDPSQPDPFDAVLVKPCPLERLLDAIERAAARTTLSDPPVDDR